MGFQRSVKRGLSLLKVSSSVVTGVRTPDDTMQPEVGEVLTRMPSPPGAQRDGATGVVANWAPS